MQLRPEQTDLIARARAALRSHRRVLVQAPTGFGKSVVLGTIVASARERCAPVWVLAHRKELLDQLSLTLWRFGVTHSWVLGRRTFSRREKVQLGSIISLWNRRQKLPTPGMLVVDEAHHCTSPTYRRLLEHARGAWVVGFTATPERLDGEPLGDIFDSLVCGPTTGDLIQMGRLSPYRLLGAEPPTPGDRMAKRGGDYARQSQVEWLRERKIIGDAPKHYLQHVYPRTCLIFSPTRAVAKLVQQRYHAVGVACEYVDGKTPPDERLRCVNGLRDGSVKVLSSVDLFSEGLDCPGLTAVQMLRPTQSLALYLQQVGRALRIEDGKEHAIILDHVKNVWRHGLPDAPREWDLRRGRKKRVSGASTVRIAYCGECFAVFRAGTARCPACGAVPRQHEPPKMEEDRGANLAEIQAARVKRKAEERNARSLEALVRIARTRGYKHDWVAYRWAARWRQSPSPALRKRVRKLWEADATT